MADTIHCDTHGESRLAYVCEHLSGHNFALGFNCNPATEEDPVPDAWCDNCEIIREAHDGWNEVSEKLTNIVAVCASCYRRARIRNTRTTVTLDDLASLRWKCGTCDEWHTGRCLDFAYYRPAYWTEENERINSKSKLLSWIKGRPKTFLNEDFCSIDDEHFFTRGIVELPIIGTNECFRWGVWGSLSRDNFTKLLEMHENPQRTELAPMFSWLSSNIPEYPETLNLKMYAHIQELGQRPFFELEDCDHPLAQEYHNGISAERVKEIMLARLGKFNEPH